MDESRTPPPGYPYNTLKPGEIRLLQICQGAQSDVLLLSLQVADLNRLPTYEALSYCWGDANDRIPVQCNGTSGLAITRNLHSALLRLRLPNQPRVIWADAISINQEDTEERTSQVLLMGNIYQSASSVIVYLGESIEVDGIDLWSIPPLLEAAQKKLKRTQLPIRHGTRDWVRHVLRPDYTTNGDLNDKRWNAIIKSLILMLHRPWFLRTWIIQEVALSSHAVVVCGAHSATWDDFYRAVSYAIDLDYFSSTIPEMYSSMRNIERARKNLAEKRYTKPLDLLASFRVFLATDARDKVFGLYGLLDPSSLPVMDLQPNYDLNLVTLYTNTTIYCIKSEKNLDVLSFGGHDCLPAHHKLPTWVPDWAYQDRTLPLLPRFLSTFSFGEHQWKYNWKSATSDSMPVAEFSKDGGSVLVSGYVIDKVVETGGILEKEYYETTPGLALRDINTIMKKCNKVLEKWEDICGVTKDKPYVTGEPAWDVYWKTLYAGGYPHGDEAKTKAAFEVWYEPFRTVRELVNYAANRVEEIRESESNLAWKMAAGIVWFGKLSYKGAKFGMDMVLNAKKIPASKILAFHRTMFKTERGFVGLSSRHVKVGDALALLKGGKMPFIVRPKVDGKYGIVGDAYVHGIMNGEEFDEFKCEMLHIG